LGFLVVKLLGALWDAASALNRATIGHQFGNWVWLAALIMAPFLAGLLVSWKTFREVILKICSKIPVLSVAANFFLNKEYVERMTDGGFPEVIFKHTEESWAFGTVTNDSLRVPENMTDGPITDWVVILGPPTAPVSVTAQIYLRKKSSVVYTGRYIKDTAITTASLGLKFPLDPSKFSTE
jgi:hypothetical protein